MKFEELNPFVRYALKHTRYDLMKKQRVCYDCRLFYISRGTGTLTVNGQAYEISPNFCIFLPPKSKYDFNFENPYSIETYVLNFDLTSAFSMFYKPFPLATINTFDESNFLYYPLPKEFEVPIIQKECFSVKNDVINCLELFLKKNDYYRHSASACLKLALIELLRESNEKRCVHSLVHEIQDFIRNNYQNSKLNNIEIANHFNYHPYHLNRLMKTHTNKTLHDYLIDYRIHIAKNLLQATNTSITEVAQNTGFASYTHFIKLFRERMGSSPLQYRKKNTYIGF